MGLTFSLLVLALLLEGVFVGGIFVSRIMFGSRFDPVIFTNFETQKSTESVNATMKLDEAVAARRAEANIAIRDNVTRSVERAGQELEQSRVRSKENDLVREEAERRAEEMVSQAEGMWKMGSRNQALALLTAALQKSPDYLPVLRKMAQFYEENQNVAHARFLWEKAAAIAQPQTPEMEEVQKNIARLAMLYPETKPEAAPITGLRVDLPMAKEPDKVTLTLVTISDLPLEGLYDLRFNMRITLGSRGSNARMEVEKTVVEVIFYDQYQTLDGQTIPMKVAEKKMSPVAPWMTGSEQVLSLNYKVPQGYFQRKAANLGPSYAFCGMVVRLWYNGRLHDVYAKPVDALGRLAKAGVPGGESVP